ncbi:amidohydrolase family protein [uncultured Hymenobacter sp.]|uniref:amidohydrolase family protein n=1 Tax=uncultured Hymenobacter sp. TaxID=170016 RepID=UPI0035CB40E0
MAHSSPAAHRQLTGIIDVHAHAILDVGAAAPMPTQPPWSVDRALALMDANEIAVSILSVPYAAAAARGAKANDIARRVNEQLAAIVARHPTRFGALATVPGSSMDGTLHEMAYALDTLKMDGVSTSTSLNDKYLGDALFDPWFEEMNRRRVTLLAHPTVAKASLPIDLGVNVAVLEFMFDTTRMLTNMVFTGAKKRFSNIRIISTHGGGTVPYLLTRIQNQEQVFGPGDGRVPLSTEEVQAGFASFYYDLTASTSAAQLYALQQLVPASRLLMGFDNPFMPPTTFAPALADVARWKGFSDADLALLAHENAAALFPGVAERLAHQLVA